MINGVSTGRFLGIFSAFLAQSNFASVGGQNVPEHVSIHSGDSSPPRMLFDAGSYDFSTNLGMSTSSPTFFWSVKEELGTIDVAIVAPCTDCWLGLGVSPNGGMAHLDATIGYVDLDGHVQYKDVHNPSTVNQMPVEDGSQDVSSVSVIEDEDAGTTTLRYTRDLRNCDDSDLDILPGTTRVVWAWGSKPDSFDSLPYHNTNRGSKSVMLYRDLTLSSEEGLETDEELLHVDLRVGTTDSTPFTIPSYPAGGWAVEYYEPGTNLTVPYLSQGNVDRDNVHYVFKAGESGALSDTHDAVVGMGGGDLTHCDWEEKRYCNPSAGPGTLYWWKTFDVVDLGINRKAHVIGYEPILNPDTLVRTHHLLVYQCQGPVDFDGIGYSPAAAQEVHECNFAAPLAIWAVGGGRFNFPPEAGYPVGPDDGRYFLMEFHYDSPPGEPPVHDDSGLRLFYNYDHRQHDIGVLYTGALLSDFITKPAGEAAYDIDGYCPGSCTEEGFPSDGINVFAVFLHSHLAGRAVRVQHQNSQGEELASPAYDIHYDFNLQDVNPLLPYQKFMPGDEIKTTCTYDTSDRDFVTYGGLGTFDEMCLSYFYYFPMTELSACLSGNKDEGIEYGTCFLRDGTGIFNKGFVTPDFAPFAEEYNEECGETPVLGSNSSAHTSTPNFVLLAILSLLIAPLLRGQ